MATAPTKLVKYKSYDFGGQDHDPIIDQMMTTFADEGLSYEKVAELSGLSAGTIRNWIDRRKRANPKRKPTMRPQFASVMAFYRSLGFDLRVVRPERKVSASSGVVFQRNIRAKSQQPQPSI